jgi:hypothetical protein
VEKLYTYECNHLLVITYTVLPVADLLIIHEVETPVHIHMDSHIESLMDFASKLRMNTVLSNPNAFFSGMQKVKFHPLHEFTTSLIDPGILCRNTCIYNSPNITNSVCSG